MSSNLMEITKFNGWALRGPCDLAARGMTDRCHKNQRGIFIEWVVKIKPKKVLSLNGECHVH
jgi:hypothetical protein